MDSSIKYVIAPTTLSAHYEALQHAEKTALWQHFLAELRSNSKALQYAPPALLRDPSFLICAVGVDERAILNADPLLAVDIDSFIAPAVHRNPRCYEYLPRHLREHTKVAGYALAKKGSLLAHAPMCIQANKTIVRHAIKSDGTALRYAEKSLREDPDLCLIAVKQCSKARKHIACPNIRNTFKIQRAWLQAFSTECLHTLGKLLCHKYTKLIAASSVCSYYAYNSLFSESRASCSPQRTL